MPLPVDNNLLTIRKASSLLGVSPDTLRRLEKKGQATPKRGPNGERLYSVDDVSLLKNIIRKPMGERAYSIQEASNILRVSPQTIRRWEREGRIKPNRTAGGQRVFTLKDIQTLQNTSKPIQKTVSLPLPSPTPEPPQTIPTVPTSEPQVEPSLPFPLPPPQPQVTIDQPPLNQGFITNRRNKLSKYLPYLVLILLLLMLAGVMSALNTSLNIFPRASLGTLPIESTPSPFTNLEQNVANLVAKFTKGSVIFQGSDPENFSENNKNFFWDDAKAFLGIGTNIPNSRVAISGKVDGAYLLSINSEDQDGIFQATNDGVDVTNIDYNGNLSIAGALSDLKDSTLNVLENLATGGDVSVGGGDITSSKALNVYSTTSTTLGNTTSNTTINGNEITISSSKDIYFDDDSLTSSIKLTNTATSLPNGNTGIVDAISDAWNKANSISTPTDEWGSASSVVYPNSTSDNLAIGGTTSAAPFYVAATTGNTKVGDLTVAGGNITLTGVDCTSYTNGGTLTTDASGNLVCANDDSGVSGVAFSDLTSGSNTVAAMIVDTGASLTYSNSGTINASSLVGATWTAPGAIGLVTPNSGAFTTLSSSGNLDINGVSNDIAGALNLSGNSLASSGDLIIDPTGGGVKIGTGSPGTIDLAGDDLYVTQDLEVDGTIYAPTIYQGANQVCDLSGNCASIGNYWQLNNKILSPANSTYDLAVGGTGTGSATFQVFATSGDATMSGVLTVGNGTTNSIRSPYGPLALQYKSGDDAWTDSIVTHDVSGDIDLAGGYAGGSGCTINNSTGTLTCTSISGTIAGSVSFANITSGTNTGASMIIDTGASLTYANSGTINASSLQGATWASPLAIGTTAPASGTFTLLTSNNLLVNQYATVSGSLALGSSTASPGPGNLDMSGNLTLGGNISASGYASIANQLNLTGSWGQVQTTDANADLTIQTAAGTGKIIFSPNATEAMRITDLGYVGIGTQTPSERLEVAGNIKLSNVSNSYNLSSYITSDYGLSLRNTANNTLASSQEIILDEGSTNLVHNPRPDPAGSTTSWACWNTPVSCTVTNVVDTTMPGIGGRLVRTTNTDVGTQVTVLSTDYDTVITSGQDYSVSFYAKASVAGDASTYLQRRGGAWDIISNTVTVALTTNWQKFTVKLTATATDNAQFGISKTVLASGSFDLANVQWENKSYSTSYFDGSLGSGYAWTGTAHNSNSTRTAGTSFGTLASKVFHIDTAGVLTLANNETIDNTTDGTILLTSPLTKTSGNLEVAGNATASGNITMGGQLQLGRFDATPTALGEGTMIFNASTNTFQCYNGTSWFNCGGTLYSNTNASVADGSYITVTHNLNTSDLLADSWINAQSAWKLLDATYKPAIAWEGKDTEKGVYHNTVNSYIPTQETSIVTASLAEGLLYDTFEDLTKGDSANTTSSVTTQMLDNGATNYTTLQSRIQGGRTGLIGGQTYNTATNDNDGQAYLGSNTVNDTFYYDRAKDSTPEVLVELGIDPNWYNGVTLSVATTSAQFSQNSTVPFDKNPNLTTNYNGSLIRATGTDSDPRTIYITIKSPTTFDWTNYYGDAATGVTITPGIAQTLGATGVSVTFSNVNYNTGDTFKIASWFIEPEGTTRGAKQQFPERSYVIATASSVDIIDSDTQKLWIRFDAATSLNDIFRANGIASVEALNGKVYGASSAASNAGLINANFVNDRGEHYGTTGHDFNGTISQRNDGIGYSGGTTSVTLVSGNANDVSAAVIPNAPTQEVTVSGWGYVAGDNVNTRTTENVNLPFKFNSIPNVTTAGAGISTPGTPKNLSDCVTESNTMTSVAYTNSSMFQIVAANDDGTVLSSSWNYCYTWTATGTVSPKQFVAVATGTSTSGGTDVINETNGTVAHIMTSGGVATSQIWQTKVALEGNALYMASNNSPSNYSNLNSYYGVHGLSTEASAGQYRSFGYGVFTTSLSYPYILGTATGTGQITSLAVTEGTSTIDGKSNTLYIGTTAGLSILQETQGLGNVGATGNIHDGMEENGGSVKYYTKDYVSEEMVGDIRGMWPLSANGALSMSDASIKADTLTNNGGVTAVSGVRGAAASFNGTSQWLSCTDGNCGGTSKLDGNGTATTAWSVGAWFKTGTNTTAIIIKNNVNTTYGLFIELNKVAWRIQATNIYSSTTATDNVWHHAVGTYDGTNMRLYVDGVLEGTVAYSGGVPDTTGEFTIGAWNTSGTIQRYMNGLIDEPFVTATTLSAGQVKHMYEVGYRALQSHGTGLGGGAADTNQQLGYISTGTNVVGDAVPDYNNQFMYVGTNSTTLGAVSKIQLDSDTNIKTYNSSANVPAGGPLLIDEDTNSLAVGYNLEAVGSAASGVKSMGVDNNATATSGNFVSKTFTLPKNIASTVLWVSPVLDASDGSNTLTVKASNDGGGNYVTCSLVGTDSAKVVPEREYACTFATSNNSLKVKFEFARGSTKTNTYVTQYGITWLGQTGFRIEQADLNNVRLYNYSGETQNLKLNVTGASTTTLANPWSDAGSYLYPTGYETLRVYDGAGTHYMEFGNDGSNGTIAYDGTIYLKVSSAGSLLPGTDNTQSIGASSSARWKDIFLGPGSLHLQANTTDSGYSGLGVNLDYSIGIDTFGLLTTSVNGTTLTAINPNSGNFAALGVGQFGGTTPTTYSRFGTASTDHSLSAAQDLLIGGDLELNGVLYLDSNTIAASNGTSTISFPSDPTVLGATNLLTNGTWLVQNPEAGNPGLAALMVNQQKGGDIFTASASGVSKMTLTNAGYLGIGTTAPTELLHLVSSGDAKVIIEADTDNSGEDDNPQLGFRQDGSSTYGAVGLVGTAGQIYTGSLANSIYLVGQTSAPLQLGTSNTARLTIDAGGNVGIGMSPAAAYMLDVNGTVHGISNSSGEGIYGSSSSGYGVYGISTAGNGVRGFSAAAQGVVGASTTGHGIYGSSVSGWSGFFTGTGYLGAASWTYGSDRRLKENILNLDGSGLDIISRLNPVRFDYRDGGQKNQLGFIAQEVQLVIPEAVVVTDETTGMLGLQTDFIIPYLVKGIQEQQGEIASLSGQLANLAITNTGDLNISQDNSENYQVTDNGTVVDRIGAFAQLISANIKAGLIETQELATNSLTAFQGTIDNLLVSSGLVAGNIQTKIISPLADSTDITVKLGGQETPSGKLSVQNPTGDEVAKIDSQGNAAFDGKVESEQLVVNSEATIAGTLYADEIRSKSLDDITALLAQFEADQALMMEASTWDTNAATGSALFNSTEGSGIPEQLLIANLYVTTEAAINSLSVTSNLAIGTDFVITSQDTSLNTLTKPLKIQSLALAPVEIMAGLVTIDTNGNVMISGNLAVKGEITTQKLTIKPDVEGETIVASIDASGSAMFSDIRTGKITGSDEERGSIDILPAEDAKLVERVWESTPAAVLVSPSYNTQAWVENTSQDGFTIRVSTSPESEVQRLYWWAIW